MAKEKMAKTAKEKWTAGRALGTARGFQPACVLMPVSFRFDSPSAGDVVGRLGEKGRFLQSWGLLCGQGQAYWLAKIMNTLDVHV